MPKTMLPPLRTIVVAQTPDPAIATDRSMTPAMILPNPLRPAVQRPPKTRTARKPQRSPQNIRITSKFGERKEEDLKIVNSLIIFIIF